jgi:hypothetical protein
MKKPNAPTRPVKELIVNQNDSEVSSISSPSTRCNTIDGNIESQDQLQATISSTKAGRPKGCTMQKRERILAIT